MGSRLSSDCTKIKDALSANLTGILRSLLLFVLTFIIMCFMSWELTLFLLAPLPIFGIFMAILGTYIKKYSKLRQDKLAEAGAFSEETFSGVLTIKAFACEDWARHT